MEINKKPIILSKVYKNYVESSEETAALKNACIEFQSGEFIAIVGKSGSGKSTLLNMITGIDRPTSGEIFFGSETLHDLSEAKLTAWRGKNVGIVFQFFQLIPTLSVMENILLPMDFCGVIPKKNREKKALELLDKTGVKRYADKLPVDISGGEQQRVAIARALANDPTFIVADEPTGNLDSQTAESIIELFQCMVSDGKTIIMVTHSKELAQCADRIIKIEDGNIISDKKVV